eukprot:sb/3472615/
MSLARALLRPILRCSGTLRSYGTISTLSAEEQFDEVKLRFKRLDLRFLEIQDLPLVNTRAMCQFPRITGQVAFQGSTPTLVDFYADWCAPCKQLSPVLKRVVEEHSKEVNLLMVNVDEFGDIAHEFDVMSIPCVKMVRDGQVVGGILDSESESGNTGPRLADN